MYGRWADRNNKEERIIMKLRKFAAAGLAIVMATTMFTGCGKSNDVQTGEGGTVTLRFATWDDAELLDNQQKCVDRFNESQDKIKITLEAYGNDFDTKITAGMGSGDAPDVMYMWDYPTYSGSLEPLDSYIEKEGAEYKDNFYEALWPYNSKDGSVYGIPVSMVTSCLFYNKDIFDQAGVAYPTDDWTWNDLQTASNEIQQKVDGVKGFSFGMKTQPYTYEMYLWSNGTSYVDQDGNLQGNINSKESVDVFKMFQDMAKDGSAYAAESGVGSDFLSQKTAMYVDGTWPIQQLKKEGVSFGLVQIPKFEGKDTSISVVNTCGISISKDSKHKEEAWEFVKYWTGEELNKERIETELPALKSVVASEKLEEDENSAPFYKALENCAGYTPASFIVDGWSEIDADVGLAIESIFNPSSYADPQETLEELASQY